MPSHVKLLFWLGATVVLATLVFSLGSYLLPCAVPLLAAASIRPFVGLLRQSDHIAASGHYQVDEAAQTLLNKEAGLAGLPYSPRLMVSMKEVPLQAAGALKRRYVLANARALAHLRDFKRGLYLPILLQHEVQHFAQRDLAQLHILKALFRTLTGWTIWTTILAIGYVLLLKTLGTQILTTAIEVTGSVLGSLAPQGFDDYATLALRSPALAMLGEINRRAASIDYLLPVLALAVTLVPFGAAAAALYRLWSAALSTREIYADAATIEIHGSQSISKALAALGMVTSFPDADSAPPIARWRIVPKRLRRLQFATHPEYALRRDAWNRPIYAVTNPTRNGLLVGGVALALCILTLSGFGWPYAGRWPTLVPTLAVFCAGTFVLAPAIVTLEFRRVAALGTRYVWLATAIFAGSLCVLAAAMRLWHANAPDRAQAIAVMLCRAVTGQNISEQLRVCTSMSIPDYSDRLLFASLTSLIVGLLAMLAYAWLGSRLCRREYRLDRLRTRLILLSLALGGMLVSSLVVLGASTQVWLGQADAMVLSGLGALASCCGTVGIAIDVARHRVRPPHPHP